MTVELPAALLRHGARGPAWTAWLDGLPRLLAEVLASWRLTADGVPLHRESALVLPVRDDGRPADLKLGGPVPEAAHEHLALRAWDGHAAVQLLRADPRRRVLLLERAVPGSDLHGLEAAHACAVVGDLYARLHRPALPQLDRLSVRAARWSEALAGLRGSALAPRRFLDRAGGLAADFAADAGTDLALLHGDLHSGTVLAGTREPWMVVDPQPLAGEPAYEVAPLLWHRWDEAVASGDLRSALLDRLYAVVDAAGLDEDRVRGWVTVRAMVELLHAAGGPALDRDRVTLCTTLTKAVQR